MDRWHVSGHPDRCVPAAGRIRAAVFPVSGGHGSWAAPARSRVSPDCCRGSSCAPHSWHLLRCPGCSPPRLVKGLCSCRLSGSDTQLDLGAAHVRHPGTGRASTSRIRDPSRPHLALERVWHPRACTHIARADAQTCICAARPTSRIAPAITAIPESEVADQAPDMIIESPLYDTVSHAALTRFLRELPDYVVLRNEEDLFANLQRGGDVDLLVGDLDLAVRILIRHLGAPVRIISSSYVRGYSYDWGHIDLLPTIEWRGACFLRTVAILNDRQISAKGRPVPRPAHEAVISWLTSVLFGGFFKQRYAAQLRQAIESDGMELRRTLIAAAGNRLGRLLCQAAMDGHPEIAATWTRSLRRSVWMRACLKSPIGTVQRCGAFVLGELRRRFKPPVPWIA